MFATLQDNVRQCLQLTGSARYILKYRDEADEEVSHRIVSVSVSVSVRVHPCKPHQNLTLALGDTPNC